MRLLVVLRQDCGAGCFVCRADPIGIALAPFLWMSSWLRAIQFIDRPRGVEGTGVDGAPSSSLQFCLSSKRTRLNKKEKKTKGQCQGFRAALTGSRPRRRARCRRCRCLRTAFWQRCLPCKKAERTPPPPTQRQRRCWLHSLPSFKLDAA